MALDSSGRLMVGGGGCTATANFTPTAVSYTTGNIIDTAKEFAFTFADGSAIPRGSLIRLLSSVIKIDAATLIASEGAYSGYAYSVTPPSARANNAAWTLATGDLPAYRGPLTLGTPVDVGQLYIKTQFTDVQDFNLTTSSLWLELVNSGTFTGAAVARQVHLYGIVL